MGEFSDDDLDALTETANVAMGRAGAALHEVLGAFVKLSIPEVFPVAVVDVPAAIGKLVTERGDVSATTQSFSGLVTGEVVAVFGETPWKALAAMIGYDPAPGEQGRQGFLLEMATVLTGACLKSLATQLRGELFPTAAALLCQDVPFDRFLERLPASKTENGVRALVLGVKFHVHAEHFGCDLIFVLAERSLETLRSTLARMGSNR